MAVAVILEFAGATPEDYDRVLAELGLAEARRGEPGLLFHWIAALPGGGIRVVDVWDDRDLAEAFVRDRLVGATQAFGATEPPAIEVLDVHNFLREG
ncbi:MAG TPA: hypothetical protein PKD59_10785 [Miltoncostaeaceae bacterium]|nr:hypothetical protein [Miltoncostaeaceae bacterium]